ncbi:Cysteine-rich receptor-like protein kinase 10 [Apostasia shenzhenica]|uniref:Cysteine-rich receptor-like protein kinase 10 n=1 Tax=Apostasia shenzhenica TaxID=1088818 RepID=A0A2I0BG40_9ASPA|nr:Cysteine-rich receptor-like protein kinase 10 [Apostasia shenzhenica]
MSVHILEIYVHRFTLSRSFERVTYDGLASARFLPRWSSIVIVFPAAVFFLLSHFSLSTFPMTKPTRILDYLFKRFARCQHRGSQQEDLESIAAGEQKVFRFETLAAATSNFSPQNELGVGGFGPVYKGRLKDGRVVAVKRLGYGSRQGDREFANEAMLLSGVQHKNIVKLYGYCAHADDKLLVYEYVPNESLDKILFSKNNQTTTMTLDWRRRYEVMVGVARGLQYLHEDARTPIIHRDIKASNILLDEQWCAKIADFGISRLFPETGDLTHINTRVAGTNGYMAPEYVMNGSLSPKADVFSFGVVIIELVSGQKTSAFVPQPGASTLVEWAWRFHRKKLAMEILDPALASTADADQVALCVHVALLCTQADPNLRPDMRRVIVILSKKPTALEDPTKPGELGSRYRRKSKSSSRATRSSAAFTSTTITSSPNAGHSATTSSTASTAAATPPRQQPDGPQLAYETVKV